MCGQIDNMFSSEARALQIIHKADDITQNAKFKITIEELQQYSNVCRFGK